MPTTTSFTGFIVPGTQGTRIPGQSRLHCQYVDSHFNLFDVPPWGIILPREVGEPAAPVRFSLETETLGLPAGTMVGMRWTPASGHPIHQTSLRLDGNEQRNALLPIDKAWLQEAEGQAVLLEHEIVLPDGTIRIGEAVTVHVARRLVFDKSTVGDLQPGDVLDPDRYPDGLQVTYGAIEHIREYHEVYLSWAVMGVKGQTHIVLYRTQLLLPGQPGGEYRFLLPPDAYTDLGDSTYERIYAQAVADVKLLPVPNPQFMYGYGGQQFPLLRNSKGQ